MIEEGHGTVVVLDHGYVKLVEKWGGDSRIVEAARMSTDKGFLGWDASYTYTCPSCGYRCTLDKKQDLNCPNRHPNSPDIKMNLIEGHPGDKKLLKYLWEHQHLTPFEMGGMTIEVQAPIMVFREWHRHRTQSYNELSARYTPLPDLNYMPTPERCLMVSGANRQAGRIKGASELTHGNAILWLQELTEVYEEAQRVYRFGLDLGIPKELARLPVPVGRYSRMQASTNLRNWLGFLTLRLPETAQWEIRQFSNVVFDIVKSRFPRSAELFEATMNKQAAFERKIQEILALPDHELRAAVEELLQK